MQQVNIRICEHLHPVIIESKKGHHHSFKELDTSRQQFVRGFEKRAEPQARTTLDLQVR